MRSNKKYQITVFIFLASLSLGANIVSGSVDSIVAIVNDTVITQNELKKTSIFPNQTLSFVIEKKLQLQAAAKKGIIVSPAEIDAAIDDIRRTNSFISDEDFKNELAKQGYSIETYKNDIREQLTIIKLVNKEVKSKISITDKEIESYYHTNRSLFSEPEEVRIGYVYVPVNSTDNQENKQEALALINEIRSDISENGRSLAFEKEKYRNKSTVTIIEDLGFIKKGQLLREIDAAAFSLSEGDLSSVISTQSGFYLLKILEKKGIEFRPFNEVKPLVREKAFIDKSEQIFKEWIYDLKTSAYIEIKTN